MNDYEFQNAYFTYKNKIKVYSGVSAIVLVIFLCLPINPFIKIPVALIGFFVAITLVATVAKKKYLEPVLCERLDPKSYLSLIYATNNANKYAYDENLCAFLLNEYERAANICLSKLADPKCKAYRFYYMVFLARIYFNNGEYGKLNEIREKFKAETALKRTRLQRLFPCKIAFSILFRSENRSL